MPSKSTKPPGPAGRWPLGSTREFAADTRGFIADCMAKYGSIAYAKIAFRDFYILLDPEPIDHVLRTNHRNYRKSFAYEGLKIILGNGLLTSEGSFWLKQRRLAQPAFHKATLGGLKNTLSALTEAKINAWKEKPKGQPLDLTAELLSLTREMLTQTLFGEDARRFPETEQIGSFLPVLRQFANDKMKNPFLLPLWVPNRYNKRFKTAVSSLETIIERIISAREKSGEIRADLLGLLMHTQDADTGEKMSRRQLKDEVLTVFLAGQETTSSALSIWFDLMARHPEEREKALLALQKSENVLDCPALRRTLDEALRLYPPGWAVSREAIGDDELCGYKIPAGSTVFVSIYAMQRSPKFWEQPDEFRPDRWLKPLREKRAYLPFGAGPRFCIGKNLALMEMQLIAGNTLLNFDWKLADDKPLEVITPITLGPKEPVRVFLEKR